MPQPGYQWRRSGGRIMEYKLIPLASGAARRPGKIKKENKSCKPQAPSLTSFKL